nr:uncharacterized mitochondrial protein AtMg00810-like [Ipomoea batatas]
MSKKQVAMSHSSSEAEYRALVAAACEIQWLHYLLEALEVVDSPPVLFTDSKSVMAIVFRQQHNSRRQIYADGHPSGQLLQAEPTIVDRRHAANIDVDQC